MPEMDMGSSPAPAASPAPISATPPVGPAPAPPPPTAVAVAATIAPDPPKARHANLLTLTVTGSDGKPLIAATVTADVAMTSMDMGTSHPAFQDLGDGRYQAPVTFSMVGPWRVAVTVTPPHGGPPLTRTFDYGVGR